MHKHNTRGQTRLLKDQEQTRNHLKAAGGEDGSSGPVKIKQEEAWETFDLGINGNEALLWDVYKEHDVLSFLETLHQECAVELEKSALFPSSSEYAALTLHPLDDDCVWLNKDPFIGANLDYNREGSEPEQGSWMASAEAGFGDASNMSQATQLPAYLMAGAMGSPTPSHYEYMDEGFAPRSNPGNGRKVKEEGLMSSIRQGSIRRAGDEDAEKELYQTGNQQKAATPVPPTSAGPSPTTVRRSTRKPRTNSRPLVERLKRHSDDDGDSVDSIVSDGQYTDGTDFSDASNSPKFALKKPTESPTSPTADMPSLPRIPAVVGQDQAKRQRRDVSMSAPAVAARELRLKKKAREEQLIHECNDLKEEAEMMERETREARRQLDKLREDAAYLRSLVKSQQSTVDLLQYLQNAPFFRGRDRQGLQLDSGNMLRQINGERGEETNERNDKSREKEVGGICLHINGNNITLHLCSHCSSEAGSR